MSRYWIFLFSSIFLASISQTLLKISARKTHSNLIREYLNFHVIIGYILLGISTILTIMALRGIHYKNVPVTETLSYVIVMVISVVVFREKISWKKLIGYGMIILGIIIFYF